MRKLLHDEAYNKIKEIHTDDQIKNGILTIRKIEDDSMDRQLLLEEKLVEEVMEYIFAPRDTKHEELKDVLDVVACLMRQDNLQGNSHRFAGGHTLENTK